VTTTEQFTSEAEKNRLREALADIRLVLRRTRLVLEEGLFEWPEEGGRSEDLLRLVSVVQKRHPVASERARFAVQQVLQGWPNITLSLSDVVSVLSLVEQALR
jgi:hypothetical protein